MTYDGGRRAEAHLEAKEAGDGLGRVRLGPRLQVLAQGDEGYQHRGGLEENMMGSQVPPDAARVDKEAGGVHVDEGSAHDDQQIHAHPPVLQILPGVSIEPRAHDELHRGRQEEEEDDLLVHMESKDVHRSFHRRRIPVQVHQQQRQRADHRNGQHPLRLCDILRRGLAPHVGEVHVRQALRFVSQVRHHFGRADDDIAGSHRTQICLVDVNNCTGKGAPAVSAFSKKGVPWHRAP
eukprot:scaffold825_cov249-Pinguiococcus_pyrenoidosus.AAC.33